MEADVSPQRIQLSRAKGWRMPPDTRKVDRATHWGNWAAWRIGARGQAAVDAFKRWMDAEASEAWKLRARVELRGKNLACWCKPDAPCHADVLLEFANARDLLDDVEEQGRALLLARKARITVAHRPDTVAIEACWALVVHPDDEARARASPGFVPAHRYPPTRRTVLGEIGALRGLGARVIVDPSHAGGPKLYAAGERVLWVA